MKKVLLLALAGGLLLGGWQLWSAVAKESQEPRQLKPVAVLSLAGYDKTMDNVALLGKAFGTPAIARDINLVLKLVAIQQGLARPDRARPWGAVIQTDGENLTGCAFVPSNNLSDLAAMVRPLVGEAEDLGGGVYRIRSSLNPVYVKQSGGWAFFAYSPKALDFIPADPLKLLVGLNQQYDAALRIYAGDMLPKQRQQVAEWLSTNIGPYWERWSYEPAGLYDARRKLTDDVFRPMLEAIDQLDQLTIGWRLDTKARSAGFEVSVTAKADTPTARRINELHGVKSQFAGFRMSQAALTGVWSLQGPRLNLDALDPVFQWVSSQVGLSKDSNDNTQPESIINLLGDIAALIRSHLSDGRLDGGMAVLLGPDTATAVAGGFISDGSKLDDALRTAVEAAIKLNPALAEQIELDVAQHHSVMFHALSLPIPENTPNRQRIVERVGEKLELAVGIGPQFVFVAAGREPIAAIKQVIDLSADEPETPVPPVEFSLAAGTVARFVAGGCVFPAVRSFAALLAAAMDESDNRNHLRFIANSIPNGIQYRLEIEEGLLCLIGRLAAIGSAESRAETTDAATK